MARKNSSQAGDTELLSRFVATFGTWDELLAHSKEVPPELRADTPDDGNGVFGVRWQPIPFKTAPSAVEELERALPRRFPLLYRELVLSYRYLEVDLGRYRLLANPPSTGLEGLREAMFSGLHLFPTLVRHGYVQFGMGPDMNYDPVCFHTGLRHGADMAIYRLDHEETLCHDRIVVRERLADSFRELVEDTIERHRLHILSHRRLSDELRCGFTG